MQLNVAEFRPGLDRSGSRGNFHEPVAHLPPRRPSAAGSPRVEVGAIEQDDGVTGRPPTKIAFASAIGAAF